MSDPVVIGIREVYNEVVGLKTQVSQFIQSTAMDVALLRQRIETLEKEREAEKTRRWQGWLQLLATLVAIAMGTLAIILK